MAATTVAGTRRKAAGERAATGVDGWRLAAALAALLALSSFVLGTAWDIQWHTAVGRDRPLTWPHVLMLAGIALAGLVSLALVLFDTWRFRRGGAVTEANSSLLAGWFRGPLGFAAAGVGALAATVAFPLDDYWHTLYGIDVTLWAPFHVMIIVGVVLAGVGASYGLASELNRAARPGPLAQGAQAALLGTTFASLLLLLPQANSEDGLARIGSYEFVLYPALLGFAAALLLLTAARTVRMAGAATVAVLTFLALRWLIILFVPRATELVVLAEGLAYRPNAPETIIAAEAFPVWVLLGALLTDAADWWRVRRLAAGRAEIGWLLPLAAGAGALLATLLDQPWSSILRRYYFPDLDAAAMYVNALPWTLGAIALGLGAAHALNRGLLSIKH